MKKTKQETKITVTLQVGNDSFSAKSQTLNEALDKVFAKTPPKFKQIGGISVVNALGKKSLPLRLTTFNMQMMGVKKVYRDIFAKRLATLL